MNKLTATTTRPLTGSAGRHEKHLPAGTLVELDADRLIDRGWTQAQVVGRPRVKVWVNMDRIEAA